MTHLIKTPDRWHRKRLIAWSHDVIDRWVKRYQHAHDHHHFWLYYHAWQRSSKAMLDAFVQGYYPVGCVQAFYRLMPTSRTFPKHLECYYDPNLHCIGSPLKSTLPHPNPVPHNQDQNYSDLITHQPKRSPIAKRYQKLAHYY